MTRVLLLALLAALCAPAPAPADPNAPAPAPAPEPGRIDNAAGGFSYVLPAGWVVGDATKLNYGQALLSKETGPAVAVPLVFSTCASSPRGPVAADRTNVVPLNTRAPLNSVPSTIRPTSLFNC